MFFFFLNSAAWTSGRTGWLLSLCQGKNLRILPDVFHLHDGCQRVVTLSRVQILVATHLQYDILDPDGVSALAVFFFKERFCPSSLFLFFHPSMLESESEIQG